MFKEKVSEKLIGKILAGIFVFVLILWNSACQTTQSTAKLPEEKPTAQNSVDKNAPKIVAFGDSLTAGFGLTEKESYPSLLQEKMKANGLNYLVINAGSPGDTTEIGLNRLNWTLKTEKIEIMILELGANDMLRGVPVAETRKNLEEIIKKVQSKNIKILLCGMFAPTSYDADYQKETRQMYLDLVKKYKLAFMPFFLDGVALKKNLNQPDGIHPNAEGTKIVAENVYKAVKPLLKNETK
jgi:acyl-CoA thioesterase-1